MAWSWKFDERNGRLLASRYSWRVFTACLFRKFYYLYHSIAWISFLYPFYPIELPSVPLTHPILSFLRDCLPSQTQVSLAKLNFSLVALSLLIGHHGKNFCGEEQALLKKCRGDTRGVSAFMCPTCVHHSASLRHL